MKKKIVIPICAVTILLGALCLHLFVTYIYSSSEGVQMLDSSKILSLVKLESLSTLVHIEDQEKWDGKDQTLRLRGYFDSRNKGQLINILTANGFKENGDLYFITGDDDSWWHNPVNGIDHIYMQRESTAQTDNIKIIDITDGRSIILFESVSF